jgi:hypothetical protein
MVDLKDLVPSRLKMAGEPWRWGLMILKWFEHKGCISLDKITAYLEERDAFKKEDRDFTRVLLGLSFDSQVFDSLVFADLV